MGSIKDRVAIIGMGCTRFGELWDKIDDLYDEIRAYTQAKTLKITQAALADTSSPDEAESKVSETKEKDELYLDTYIEKKKPKVEAVIIERVP